MFKKMSVAKTIVIPVLAVLFIGITILNATTGINASIREDKLTMETVMATVNEHAGTIQVQWANSFALASSAAPFVEQLRHAENGRERVVEAFEAMVDSNPDILGIWSVWEPDAFDGADRQYAGRPNHDATGRFVPLVYRANGQILTEPSSAYEDAQAGRYYQQTKATGKVQYVGPIEYRSKSGDFLLYSVCVPVIADGRFLGAVGVHIDVEAWDRVLNEIKLTDGGFLSVIDPNGIVISTPTKSRWLRHFAEDDDTYKDLVSGILRSGGTATSSGRSTTLGTKSFLFYTGIQLPQGEGYWAICGIIPQYAFHRSVLEISLFHSLVGIIILAGTAALIAVIVHRQLADLPKLSQLATRISEGRLQNLRLDADPSPTNNEVQQLRQAFSKLVRSSVQSMDVMLRIAQGDLSMDPDLRSDEDVVGEALRQLLQNNNRMLLDIKDTADTVNDGAQQIADNAQLLSTTVEEHASSVNELSSFVQEVSTMAADNQDLADGAASLNAGVQEIAVRGVEKMKQLNRAVEEIDRSSKSIGNVIRVIEDIAFQTNILALNAAVEAARAGQQGRGFAVVADEVRNLAGKSAEAAKNSNQLILDTIAKADLGADLAGETSAILDQIMENISDHAHLIERIPTLLRSQAAALKNIEDSVHQIDRATQSNSTMAEESASSSEEFRNQAQILHHVVARYKLNETMVASYTGAMRAVQKAAEFQKPIEEAAGRSSSMALDRPESFSFSLNDKY